MKRPPSAWWYVLPFHVPIRHFSATDNNAQVIRGNSVVMLEALERISDK